MAVSESADMAACGTAAPLVKSVTWDARPARCEWSATTREVAPTLSICLRCRDGREAEHQGVRGGARLAEAICQHAAQQGCDVGLRGISCMSQCKRPCVISLTAPEAFTYVFGDLDPSRPDHVQAILDLMPLYNIAPEGYLARDARPEPLRASILGRLPAIGSSNAIVSALSAPTPAGKLL